MKEINVGIDLGTTYSAVAVFDSDGGKVDILKNKLEEETTPSVVCIENGEVLIGVEAKNEQAAGNENVAAFYKSLMGNEREKPYLDGREYTAEELSGIFLRELKKSVEEANDVVIKGAVITVPAYFNEAQRQATIRAGEAAGLKVLKIINEPTAAIIAYGLTGQGKRNVMVYDLGGGTFDVTIAEINGTNVDVIATNGNHQLGGKNWDSKIADYIIKEFNSDYEVNIEEFPDVLNELYVKCEKAKKQLTNMPSVQISINCDGNRGNYTITREQFDEMTSGYLNETLTLTEICFKEIGNGFNWNSLDEVVLVGGSTRMPQVAEEITRVFGKAPRIIGNKVDTIVATGAAMQAGLSTSSTGTISLSLTGLGVKNASNATLTLSNDDIKDVTSHSLGMLAFAADGKDIVNSIIIKKNSTTGVPFGRNYNFKGEKLEVYVLQGELTDPYQCTLLYKYIVTGMPKGDKNDLTVYFQYNQNGVVDVTANLKSGQGLNVEKTVCNESLEEIIARLKREREEAKRVSMALEVMLMIDTSGSMSGDRMKEAKKAAKEFVNQFDLAHTKISVISFSDRSKFQCDRESDLNKLIKAVDKVEVCDTGVCNAETPIKTNHGKFGKNCARVIVVLTDGYWEHQDREITAAEQAKKDGIIIYGIGIGGADEKFLAKISSGKGRKVDLSQLTATFKEVASSIATETGAGSLN